jgi:hypothetical protein
VTTLLIRLAWRQLDNNNERKYLRGDGLAYGYFLGLNNEDILTWTDAKNAIGDPDDSTLKKNSIDAFVRLNNVIVVKCSFCTYLAMNEFAKYERIINCSG